MRDKGNYHAANGCSQAAVLGAFCRLLQRVWHPLPAAPCPPVHHVRVWRTLVTPASGRGSSIGVQSIGIHANGVDTFLWNTFIRDGLDWYPLPSSSVHTNGRQSTAQRGRRLAGENDKGDRGLFTTMPATSGHQEVRVMPRCVACGSKLEPPVRSPHRLRQEPVPHRRPGVLPPPHRQGRGGRRCNHGGQTRRRLSGERSTGVNLAERA